MSTKIENVVYRASWRDEISATLNSVSFSTATPVNKQLIGLQFAWHTQNRETLKVRRA